MFEIRGIYKRCDTWPARENWPARPLVFMLDPDTGADYSVDAVAEVVAYLEQHGQPLTPIVARCVVARANKQGAPQLRIDGLSTQETGRAAK